MSFDDLIRKARDGERFTKDELVRMLGYPSDSPESYQLMAEANRISKDLTGNKAEVHAQLALNLGPCPCDCAFCSFAEVNGVFKDETRLTPEQAVAYATQFEADGANAVFVMTTAYYPFEQFIETSQEIRRHLLPETILIANVGDQPLKRAEAMKQAGFTGVYHALRLREGIDTQLSPQAREESIRDFQEAGLGWVPASNRSDRNIRMRNWLRRSCSPVPSKLHSAGLRDASQFQAPNWKKEA